MAGGNLNEDMSSVCQYSRLVSVGGAKLHHRHPLSLST